MQDGMKLLAVALPSSYGWAHVASVIEGGGNLCNP